MALSKLKDNYVGESKNMIRDGFGVYKYVNKFYRYEGEWKNGKKHGHGKFIMNDGTYYEGEFRNGEISGHGYKFWKRKNDEYVGEFHMGHLHGRGNIEYGNGDKYEGEFSMNQRQGKGILHEANGNIYDGNFYKDKRHGEGVQKYYNNDVYNGYWIAGKRHGFGMFVEPNSLVYEGQFNNDLYHGQGVMKCESGLVYEGVWQCGKPENMASRIKLSKQLSPCYQGQLFDIDVCIVNENDQALLEETNRVLKISCFYQNPILALNEDQLKLAPSTFPDSIETPFGYSAAKFPLEQQTINAAVNEDRDPEIHTGNTDDVDQENLVTADNENAEKENYLLGKTQNGFCEWKNLVLPRVSSTYFPYWIQDNESYLSAQTTSSSPTTGKDEAGTAPAANEHSEVGDKAAPGSGSASKKKKMLSKEEIAEEERKKKLKIGNEMFARSGEYVLLVEDVTEPEFLASRPESLFIRIILKNEDEDNQPKEKEKRKNWDTKQLIAHAMVIN